MKRYKPLLMFRYPLKRPPHITHPEELEPSLHRAFLRGVVEQRLAQPLPPELKALVLQEEVLLSQALRARQKLLRASLKVQVHTQAMKSVESLLKRKSEQ